MTLRYSMPRVRGRGAGLGNELVPWARAFLAAQVVGAEPLPPAFGFNPRKYWRHFGTPRYDWLLHRAMEYLLPVIEFTEADYLRCGGGDALDALRQFAKDKGLHDRQSYLLVTEGMWGGYRHISAARDFVFSTLYQSRFAARNLVRLSERLDPSKPVVGMHVRLGDFGAPLEPAQYRGRFNLALPLDWYRNIARSIRARLGDGVQFLIVSDGTREQLAPLIDIVPAVTTSDILDADCSDLLALVKADLLVCSVSSYSAWAAFLSDAPYLWYESNLQRHEEGCYSIWGHEDRQREPGSATRRAVESLMARGMKSSGRGVPVGPEGEVLEGLLLQMMERRRRLSPATDLVQYGVVPAVSGQGVAEAASCA